MNKLNIRGSIVALVTPMLKNGDIDEGAFKALLEWHMMMRTNAILIAGTTGESPTLTLDENCRLIAEAVKCSAGCSAGRIPIIGGVGANSTAEAIILTQQAAADGADAGLSVIPYYNKPTQEGLFRHFSAIADSSEMPIILYDVPKRCITTFADETLQRLAAHPRIIGIKDASGDISRFRRLRDILPPDFMFYSGDDGSCTDYLLSGGHGVISVTANIAPQQMSDMAAAAMDGDEAQARQIDALLRPLHSAQSVESNPIPIKWALAEDGRISPSIRLPLTPLAGVYHDTVRSAVNHSRTEKS